MFFFIFTSICIMMVATIFVPYAVYQSVLDVCCKSQDLRKRYNAKWGLVTGASSGKCIRLFVGQEFSQPGVILSPIFKGRSSPPGKCNEQTMHSSHSTAGVLY